MHKRLNENFSALQRVSRAQTTSPKAHARGASLGLRMESPHRAITVLCQFYFFPVGRREIS
jgi:hypothetical protein